MENKRMIQIVRSVKGTLMAHPDNEENSEFADRISSLEELEQALSMSGVVESADFPSINNEGTPLLDEYGKKICNCVDPNRTYFPDGAIVCMNCWGEWYH